MPVSYSKKSLYYDTPSNDFALGYYVHRNIPLDDTDQIVVIEQRHHLKPTSLSYDLYGTPAYWWVFNVLNMDTIKDPIRDFTVGKTIRVPTLVRIQRTIG